jgi:hypothetical protein
MWKKSLLKLKIEVLPTSSWKGLPGMNTSLLCLFIIYDNKYSLIINICFYETFSTQTSSACAPSHLLDTLSNILGKCSGLSLIKIESVSINPSQATLGSLFLSVVYTFRLKMLLLVLIQNCNSFVYLIWILSNKLDLNLETRFTIISYEEKSVLSTNP